MSIDLDSTWFQQPCCCCCGGSDDRPDDPCEAYSADRFGPDWMHRSCMAKFVAWEREQIVEQNEAEARARGYPNLISMQHEEAAKQRPEIVGSPPPRGPDDDPLPF